MVEIDVENSEHLVLEGIIEEDWSKIKSLVIEVHDVNHRLSEVVKKLERKGFLTFVEKERSLSADNILYNLYAIRNQGEMGLTFRLNAVDRLRHYGPIPGNS